MSTATEPDLTGKLSKAWYWSWELEVTFLTSSLMGDKEFPEVKKNLWENECIVLSVASDSVKTANIGSVSDS